MEGAVSEVPLDEALGEGENVSTETTRPAPGVPSVDEGIKKAAAEAKEDLDLLAPKNAAREWTFGQGDLVRTYIQRELSVIGKMQWFGLLGEILDEALSGDHAISLNSLLSPPTPRAAGQFQIQDFQDADTFVHAMGKLLVFSPKFVHKSVCIWLSVPDYEWELVEALMRESPEQGGMSDEAFEEIVATFIDQNYPSIDRFFRERSPRLRARYQARAKEASQLRSSKQ